MGSYMNSSLKAFLSLFLLSLAQPLWAEDGPQQLDAFLKDLDTLQADFRQTLQQQQDDGQVYAGNGVFYLKRPGLLRWEYDTPDKQLIVADGNRIWLHDIELEQVSHRSQQAALDGTPAQLLSDLAPVTEHFQVRDLGEQEGLSWVELLPKEKEAQFASVRLALSGNRLQRMEMIDNFGQTTRFFFDNVQRNPILDDALFKFEPPPMIDLIGDL
ncbi:MAG: outer membrane lipoprotein chaperone LolA [Candidatus Thiodiazotropha sp. (ex Epidulcina cf. delphinae)]|nr:outer membrane lipoprotein chaperone LolA [Candidatus Thiodiazotropha sp. (ex Epidulcina cf. delphinae)]